VAIGDPAEPPVFPPDFGLEQAPSAPSASAATEILPQKQRADIGAKRAKLTTNEAPGFSHEGGIIAKQRPRATTSGALRSA
jgi:hypothetical protein